MFFKRKSIAYIGTIDAIISVDENMQNTLEKNSLSFNKCFLYRHILSNRIEYN